MKKYASLLSGLTLIAMVSACSPASEQPTTPTATSASTAQATGNPASPAADATPKPDASKSDAKPDTTASNGTWQDYKSSAGKFSIKVPSKPQEQSQEQKTEVGNIKLNMVIAEAKDSGYFVGYADFPGEIQDAQVQKGLGDAIKGSVANLNGAIKSEKEFMLGDIPCRDFEADGKVQTTDVLMKGRFCLSGNRLYQVFALGAKDKLSTADVDMFIGSFKVES